MQAAGHPLIPARRIGQVISYSPTPAPTVEVAVGADTTTTEFAPFLDSYFPVVNDYVVLLENQGDYVCLGSVAGATPKRCGVTVSYSDSYTTDGFRTISGTWTYGETVGGFAAGATTGNGTPVIIPAGADGMYAITHVTNTTFPSGGIRGSAGVAIGGTMTPSNLRTDYRVATDTAGASAYGAVGITIPLSAGQTVAADVYMASGNTNKTLDGALTCYRIGD